MKILLIHQFFLEKGDGGGSRFNEMTKNWSENGHKITVLAGMVHYATGEKLKRYKGKWTFTDKEFYPNVDVIRCHVSESYNLNFLGRLWAYFSFVFSSVWAGLFKTGRDFDVILVTSPPLFVGITAYILTCIKRIPFIFEVRDLWPESAIDTGVLKNKLIIRFSFWFENFIYKKATLINVLTPAFRDKLINEKRVSKDKVFFIPNAADFSLSEKLEGKFSIEQFRKDKALDGKFVITYVGAHGVANHLIQLIDAADQLQDTNVLFLLIGAGMKKEELKDTVKNRDIKNVKFIDSVPKEDVFKYILASEMGVSVLKKVDTFKTIYSNKTFDYMSCKKPVLLAIDGISRQLIEDAKCGYYVEPENIKDIVRTIRKILNEPEKLIEMGLNGYNYAKQHFDRNVLAQEYLLIISTVKRTKIGVYKSFFKRLIDFIFSILGIILLCPVFIILMLLLMIINKGNPFFLQRRPGMEEKIFKLIKFKTMTDKYDQDGNLLSDDHRLTNIGLFIRKTSLDEIPQLINVLKGEMSFIGPRPLLVEYLSLYNDEQKKRHKVKPGITGWAQVNGRNAISWRKKIDYDLWYVENISFFLDIKIIFMTLKKVILSEGISSGSNVTMEKFTGNN